MSEEEIKQIKEDLSTKLDWWKLSSEEAYILQGVEHILEELLETTNPEEN